MEKIKWSKKVTNEQVFERIGEKRTLLNNVLGSKVNWIGHIVRINCLLHEAIEEQMTEVKGVGRRKTQLHNVLRNRRKYWELREEKEGHDSLSSDIRMIYKLASINPWNY